MKSIALIGFMGSGKTTIGQILGKELTYPVIDVDEQIEKKTNMTIKKIFETKGENWFREKEGEELNKWVDQNVIVSTGGGIITKEQNRNQLKEQFNTIWLRTSFEEIMKRLAGEQDTRPLWRKPVEERRQLFLDRESLYKQVAHYIIWTDGRSQDEIAQEIINLLQLYKTEK
ncbi:MULTISPECIES: shikimate kinase [Allobacillus]|nr:shikimate kinase [Allobacillus salarius]